MYEELMNSRTNGATEAVAAQRTGHGSAFIIAFLRGERKVHCRGRQNFCIRSGSVAQAFCAKKECQIGNGEGLIIPGGTRITRTKTKKEGKADHICHRLAFSGVVVVEGEFECV